MNKKWIAIGVSIILVIIIGGIVLFNTDLVFKDSSLNLEDEDLSIVIGQSNPIVNDSINVSFSNMSELGNYLTVSEINDLEDRLENLFTDVFPRLSNIKSDFSVYYKQNIEELNQVIRCETEEEFISLLHKINRIKKYENCSIELNLSSLAVEENNYYMNIYVVYDQNVEIEYYMILDLEDLELTIK